MDVIDLAEAFEHQIEKRVKKINLDREFKDELFFTSGYDKSVVYKDPGTQLLWEIFVAGLEKGQKSARIRLPQSKENPDNFYDVGYNEGIEDCRKHLQAQKIKVI
ncbi:hypothetical protein [Xenorhabdus bovienii]|uniref:hypothetical protein n=1 Tax=Xenorhabdus bovienii TaxID=40576 RepID=UPI0023B2E6E6|nr:hypothetical protein [Xenorhabdus bovienii]MDE9570774.1 hypothetical protein [Xenorhabdus bovienii]MDE9590158.1 hypothetical protein [Xenorhabdus bovienii]